MNNNEFEIVGLYDHNANSYRDVKSSFDAGNDVVGIVHATGTGKSYNALQLAYDNKDKKIVYIVPYVGIIEHIKKIIDDNPNLDLKRDFPNLEFRTYQSFKSLSREEISNIECDLLILDEFHHLGAPVWGPRINTMIESHPGIKVFGMTAYTVRDRGTPFERDMANPDTDELFSNKIESRYDLCDAMIDGVLPKPIYKTAYTNLLETAKQLEERVKKIDATTKEYKDYIKMIDDVKRKIHEAPSIPEILKKSIKPNGKYIYFCPKALEEGENDIETIKKQAIEWLKQIVPEEDIVIYTTKSDMGEKAKQNRNAFYDDVTLEGEKVDNKLRIMFAINQYNEGIHAPNVDGVIMGRATTSDIVYFEQLGRALSIRGNTKDRFDELEKYSTNELVKMCSDRDITVKENMRKEDLIERLIAPVVIDLANNLDYIRELENNLKDRIKEVQEKTKKSNRQLKITDYSFDIEIENQDLFETLRYVRDRITINWEDKYTLAKAFYEKNGNLEIPRGFKTINGIDFDENGVNLSIWLREQCKLYDSGKIKSEYVKKLEDIGIDWDYSNPKKAWEKNYRLAKMFFDKYGHLEIPSTFKTKNGIDYDENGATLGQWIFSQRRRLKSPELRKRLDDIGMRWEVIRKPKNWSEMYKLAENYYKTHGDLEVPMDFKTKNGVDYDEQGESLGTWITNIRQGYKGKTTRKINDEQIKLLNKIGMRWYNLSLDRWDYMYNLAKTYYEYHGNLKVPRFFKTINGKTPNKKGDDLGSWIAGQKTMYKGKSTLLSPDRIKLLEDIGMVWFTEYIDKKLQDEKITEDNLERKRKEMENRFHTLLNKYEGKEIPTTKQLNDDFLNQLNAYENKQKELEVEKRNRWDNSTFDEWMKYYKIAKAFYEKNGNLKVPQKFITKNGVDYDKDGLALGKWISKQRQSYNGGNVKTTKQRIKMLEDIGMIWFTDNIDKRLQDEKVTEDNLERKRKEMENRFYSVLNKHNDKDMLNAKQLNEELLTQLNRPEKSTSHTKNLKLENEGIIENKKLKLEKNNSNSQKKVKPGKWMKKYELAQAYYNHYGNLIISDDFRTKDGINYDEDGENLGHWIQEQRNAYNGKTNITPERIALLNYIGMQWNVEKNDNKAQEEKNTGNKKKKR